jgi:hypothetical protein
LSGRKQRLHGDGSTLLAMMERLSALKLRMACHPAFAGQTLFHAADVIDRITTADETNGAK